MDTKANLANRKKINELAIQHNKLTTLVGALLNELNGVKKDLRDMRNGNVSSSTDNPLPKSSNQKFGNLNDMRAEDILKHLSINHIDN
jgi:hypothetical protein